MVVLCAWTGVSLMVGCPAFAAASPQQAEPAAGQARHAPPAGHLENRLAASRQSLKRVRNATARQDKASSTTADKSAGGTDGQQTTRRV